MELSFLENHFMFRRTAAEHLVQILAASSELRIERGQAAYDRNRFFRSLGILLEGELQVKKENLLVSTLQPGDVFGAAALFNEEKEYPTVLAAKTECRLLLIPQEKIRWLLRTSGEFAEDYVSYLSGRIRFLSARLDTVSADRGESKLARYLLSADCDGIVTQSATQLCQRIGVGRATLYRAFELLEEDGAIRRDGKTICILDRQKLSARSGASS